MKPLLVLALLATSSVAQPAAAKCNFIQVGDLDVVSGATLSTIQVSSDKACIKKLEDVVTLSSTSGSMRSDGAIKETVATLTLHNVPTLAAGSLEWKFGDNAMTLRSTAITLQRLTVSFGQQPVGVAAKSDDGWLAVTQHRKLHEKADWDDIINTAVLDVSARLRQPRLGRWIVKAPTWGSDVAFVSPACENLDLSHIKFAVVRQIKAPLRVAAQLIDGNTVLVEIDLALAAEARAESIPLSITPALKIRCNESRLLRDDGFGFVHDGGSIAVDHEALAEKKCVLEVDYSKADRQLSSSAERDSATHFLTDELHDAQAKQSETATHAKDTRTRATDAAGSASHAQQVAADKKATATQKTDALKAAGAQAAAEAEAVVAQSAEDLATACATSKADLLRDSAAIGFNDAQRLKNKYGDQSLEITIKRGSKQGVTVVSVSPNDSPISIPLVAPADAESETGPYHVSVKPAAQPDLAYRTGALPSTDSRLAFDATLRPLDRVGTNRLARFYVTLPVSPVSLEFPARASNIQSTEHDTHIVERDSRAGVMLALEPWDFDHDENPWPVPLSLQAGLSATSASLTSTSVLAGVSIDFPIIDKTVTETSIAIGAFYEVGLEHGWSHTHRGFVLTFGLDIFRALKSNQSSELTK